MNMLLVLLLLTAGEAAYFEVTTEQQTADGYQQQINSWQHAVGVLENDNADLKRRKLDLENKISQAESEAPKPATTATPAPATAAPTTSTPAPAPATTAAPATAERAQ